MVLERERVAGIWNGVSLKNKRRLQDAFSQRTDAGRGWDFGVCSRFWRRAEPIPANRINGRGEWIRTTGLLVPNQALYQAEPRPELF